MSVKFKLLLANPCLASNSYYRLNSGYLSGILGIDLCLPIRNSSQAFIFSCFALSVDGKLCYPDLASGYAIAKMNYLASKDECYADWWNLLLGRSLSDAVIIGSNSLIGEGGNYAAEIDIAELTLLRSQLKKPQQLLHIVITRDPAKINYLSERICQDPTIPLLIYCQSYSGQIPQGFSLCQLTELTLAKNKQLVVNTDGLDIPALIDKLYQLGINTILNESPYYHHQLQQLQLLNEAWLNTSGVYIGGGTVAYLGKDSTSFSATYHPHYTLLSLHIHGYNFLFNRYRIEYPL